MVHFIQRCWRANCACALWSLMLILQKSPILAKLSQLDLICRSPYFWNPIIFHLPHTTKQGSRFRTKTLCHIIIYRQHGAARFVAVIIYHKSEKRAPAPLRSVECIIQHSGIIYCIVARAVATNRPPPHTRRQGWCNARIGPTTKPQSRV